MSSYYIAKGAHSALSRAYATRQEAEDAAEKLCSVHGEDVYVYTAVTKLTPGVRPTSKQVLDQ